MSSVRRWRGLKSLVVDAVDHGARAVERVHLATLARTYGILKTLPPIALPARTVEIVHEGTVVATYKVIRGVTRSVDGALDVLLDALENREGD